MNRRAGTPCREEVSARFTADRMVDHLSCSGDSLRQNAAPTRQRRKASALSACSPTLEFDHPGIHAATGTDKPSPVADRHRPDRRGRCIAAGVPRRGSRRSNARRSCRDRRGYAHIPCNRDPVRPDRLAPSCEFCSEPQRPVEDLRPRSPSAVPRTDVQAVGAKALSTCSLSSKRSTRMPASANSKPMPSSPSSA
jgi:hypothetical protein